MDRPSCPKVFGEAIASFFAVFLAINLTIEPYEVYPLSSPPADAHSRGVDQSLLVQWLTSGRHVLSGSSTFSGEAQEVGTQSKPSTLVENR